MKSYKDLPREVVLNAPEGAMWVLADCTAFYKFESGSMFVFRDGWVQEPCHKLSDWTSSKRESFTLIPLPNVKIPWEAAEDSVCPVPETFDIKVWIDSGMKHQSGTRNANNYRWHKLSVTRINITAYEIVDPDYMRKEPSDDSAKKLKAFCEENALIQYSEPVVKVRTRDQIDLINKLDFLNELSGRLPIISDCAKAAMERLVEKWVELS